MTNIPPYPVHWPDGVARTPPGKRKTSQFKTSLSGAVGNVETSLQRFGADSRMPITDVVATTNVGGINIGTKKDVDPGVAVWFRWDGAMRCIAIDRYPKPQDNLQAIHHILEARRTELRHGGIVIARTAFKGFTALPAPKGKHWSDVLEVWDKGATAAMIKAAYRQKARDAHPDNGGTNEAMAALSRARDEALKELDDE